MNYKNGFIHEIVYKGKKTYYFLKSDKVKRNKKDAVKICDELEKILDINKERFGNMYEIIRKNSIDTILENMQHVKLHEYKKQYGIYTKNGGFVLNNDEVVILN